MSLNEIKKAKTIDLINNLKNEDGSRLTVNRHMRSVQWCNHLPTLHCTVIGLTRERFVALGLPSWTHLRTRYWGIFTLQGLKDLLRALGLWYCESWGI